MLCMTLSSAPGIPVGHYGPWEQDARVEWHGAAGIGTYLTCSNVSVQVKCGQTCTWTTPYVVGA